MVRCFVIGPIGNKFAPLGDPARQIYEDALQVFEEVILAACQRVDIDPVRADQIAVAGEITEQVFRHLREDEVVIADVSGGNPNVMYELGLRHTTGKLTIQIGEFGQLPFDVNTIRTIRFSRSPRGLIDARKELERALQAGMVEGQDQLTATRVFKEVPEEPMESVLSDIPATASVAPEDDTPGLLDQMEDFESRMASMTDDANEITAAIEAIGMVTEATGVEVEKAVQSGASNAARLNIITKYASAIKEPVDKLEARSTSFAENISSLNSGILAMLQIIRLSPSSTRREDAEVFLDQLIEVAESSRGGMEGLNSFGASAEGLGSLSKQLRGPGKKIGNAVENMRQAMAHVDGWERAARAIKSQISSEREV